MRVRGSWIRGRGGWIRGWMRFRWRLDEGRGDRMERDYFSVVHEEKF